MLVLEGLKSGYGRIPVLHGVDLSVQSGEIVAILGHNGTGKTTLMKTVVGMVPATAGKVTFGGVDVTQMATTDRSRRGMGYVPQGREIFPRLSVEENLRLGILMHAENRGREDAVLERLLNEFPRLKPILGRQGGVLSGGEQQILAIARCLGGNPKLMLLDEPTEGIQPSIVEEIVDILRALSANRMLTIVLVEQKLDFIAALASSVYLIQRGQLSAALPVDRLHDPNLIQEFAGINP
jgi:urea ABC transporter ATP-binding protein UrtE